MADRADQADAPPEEATVTGKSSPKPGAKTLFVRSVRASLDAGVPKQLGRYHIVGQLATGGMAQILLGKLIGPQGFERPVVIKRVLPQFARDPDFVTMFLDEARLSVNIRHANVVQVQELCQEGDELFLVMEYLNGETLLNVMRRLTAQGAPARIEIALASYIIAEACQGLHAAHESLGAQGEPANLVHRDISPDNLFITYEGEVKVLDFGVAKARGRATKSVIGALKGKLAYMSPEQCRAETLDRRSDVFSLGTVLYELLTMRRLFKRKSEAHTLQAVCEAPVPPLSSVVEGCPPLLDQICARALERDLAGRYPTAKAMRNDLRRLETQLAEHDPPEDRLKQLMEQLFGERIQAKAELLQNVRLGVEIETIPEVEIEGDSFEGVSGRTEMLPAPTFVPVTRSSRPPWIVAAITFTVLVSLGLGVVAFLRRTASPPPAAAMATPAPVAATPAPVTATPVTATPVTATPVTATPPDKKPAPSSEEGTLPPDFLGGPSKAHPHKPAHAPKHTHDKDPLNLKWE